MKLIDAAVAFAPYTALALRLLAALGPPGTDGSHDLSHILRVWRNAADIARNEPDCDMEVLAAAVILHDCVAVEKNAPQRSIASRLSADRAREIVGTMGWPADRTAALAHAVEAHSFSAAIEPRTPEACIVQDADRLDAIGAIGIARCFYIAGRMGSALYDSADPGAENRDLDDKRFALDHFSIKLFGLVDGFRTEAGRSIAAERTRLMHDFVDAFRAESGR